MSFPGLDLAADPSSQAARRRFVAPAVPVSSATSFLIAVDADMSRGRNVYRLAAGGPCYSDRGHRKCLGVVGVTAQFGAERSGRWAFVSMMKTADLRASLRHRRHRAA
jgi:hypothetical protein